MDDEQGVRELLVDGLEVMGFQARAAAGAEEALAMVKKSDFQLVLSDISMPGRSGLELLRDIKAHDPDIEVIMVTGLTDVPPAIQSMRRGASDYITKPFHLEEVGIVVRRTLEKRRLIFENRAYQTCLEDMVDARTRELLRKKQEVEKLYGDLREAWEGTVQAMLMALDLRDNETQGHSWRVVEYAVLLAQRMGLADEMVALIRFGAIFHDIGKIGVPDAILRKPGALTEDEWWVMRKHPEMGYRMLQGVGFLEPSLKHILCHEERWDGSGYPRGLKGEEIPIEARIFAVVDTFDAITADRPYRSAQSIERARDEIQRFSGIQFDPEVAEVFLSIPVEVWQDIKARVFRERAELAERVKRAFK